LSFPSQFTLS